MTSGSHRILTDKEYVALREAARKLPLDATSFQVWKHLRDELLIRLLYETTASVGELLGVRVKDLYLDTDSFILPDSDDRAKSKRHKADREVRFAYFSKNSRHLIIQYIAGRKRGFLIMNNREEKMSVRTAERTVDNYAGKAGIQRTIGHTVDKDGKRRAVRFVTCRVLTEAGKRRPGPPSIVSVPA